MIRRFLVAMLMVAGFTSSTLAMDDKKITQDELVRRTQALNDAVAIGDKRPWEMYYADDAILSDEKGRKLDKAAMLADLTGLPKGYSGSIHVLNAQSLMFDTTAILIFDLDETETIFGQELKARYHQTDTWLYRSGRWQIAASQVLRYYEDPAAGKVDASRLDDYLGTYEVSPGVTETVTREGGRLYSKRAGRARVELVPEVPDLFFRVGAEGRGLFRRDGAGKVDALIERRNNEDVVWKRMAAAE